MSETPETEKHFSPIVDEGRIAAGRTPDFCRHLESDRNRWRSVAEQFYEAFDALDFERFKAARAAFDSLRKEAQDG